MSEVVRFMVELPPHGLRRNTQYRSPQALARLKDEYSEAVWCASVSHHYVAPDDDVACPLCDATATWERAHVRLTWRHHRQGPDPDNALASCKALIDVLTTKGRRPLGIVVDDSPEHLTSEMHVEKVRSKADEGVYVEVERRDP